MPGLSFLSSPILNSLRRSDILKYECGEITYQHTDGKLVADLDCYAICGYTAKALVDLARENDRTCIITIQAMDNPKLQIVLSPPSIYEYGSTVEWEQAMAEWCAENEPKENL